MTVRRDLKNLIRARMAKTGESYSIARMHVLNETTPQSEFAGEHRASVPSGNAGRTPTPTSLPAFTDAHRKWLCDRLVGISVLLEDPDGRQHTEVFTAFAMDVSGTWLLVTAGHVLGQVEELIAAGNAREWTLMDRLGSGGAGRWPIPFNPSYLRRQGVDDDAAGVDVGVLALPDNTKRLLAAGGTRAFTPEEWKGEVEDVSSIHVVGLPTRLLGNVGDGSRIEWVTGQPVFIPVAPCPAPEQTTKPIQRFYGRILSSLRTDEGVELDTIDGVSGGPIVGIRRAEEGDRYYLLAIQSSWFRKPRVVAGTFARRLGLAMEDELAAPKS